MGLSFSTDLILLFLLFALFVYVFVSGTIRDLHKVYLLFHFLMMVWPFCLFSISTTDHPYIQLNFLKFAFADTALLAVGWLLFTLFLTGKTRFLRTKKCIPLFMPALIAALIVILNPQGLFVKPLYGAYVEREYGPLFWIVSVIVTSYFVASLILMLHTLWSNKALRIKQQIRLVLKGVAVMMIFITADIVFNVILSEYLPVIPGLTSLGILLSAIFFVIAIHRDKVFDLVSIAHQDIIKTVTLGILVIDDNGKVVEINQSLPHYIDLKIGDDFKITDILPEGEFNSDIPKFIQDYQESPLDTAEITIRYNITIASQFHVNIQVAPIMVGQIMVGRMITFQDITEVSRLISETNHQNEILQMRNQTLIATQQKLHQTNLKLEKMAITDSLTGCYNRSFLTQELELEVKEYINNRIPFSIILLDIDYFKTINDNYGHLVGDRVLRDTAEVIQHSLRKPDILARYGGEEFIICLPNTQPNQANIIAERVKSAIDSNRILVQENTPPISITVSIGLLSTDNMKIDISKNVQSILNELFESVDKALYQAKNNGRNRIVSSSGMHL